MLVIRLARTGRKNLQVFRLVVQEKARSPKSGRFIEILGSYNPTEKANKIEGLDPARVEHFLKNGAVPSDTAARILIKNGVAGLEKYTKKYTKKKAKNAPEEEEKPAEKPVEEAAPADAEAPAEEEKKEEAEKPAEEKAE